MDKLRDWQRVWRAGFAPQFTTAELKNLGEALSRDDPRLAQGVTAGGGDLPCDAGCPLTFSAIGRSHRDAEEQFARRCFEATGPDMRPSIAIWQRLADPVWWHIDMMDVLNYELGRDDKDCKHICPLQLGVIREAIELWTNPGDVVYDPFNGIGSTGHVALSMGRKYIGSELKDSYYRQSLANLARAESKSSERDLFSGAA